MAQSSPMPAATPCRRAARPRMRESNNFSAKGKMDSIYKEGTPGLAKTSGEHGSCARVGQTLPAPIHLAEAFRLPVWLAWQLLEGGIQCQIGLPLGLRAARVTVVTPKYGRFPILP